MKRTSSTIKGLITGTVAQPIDSLKVYNRSLGMLPCARDSIGDRQNLPCLTVCGYLPEGVHETTMEEIEARFATVPYRRKLWQRASGFFGSVAERGGFSHAYIAGGFISSKAEPNDIDVILQPFEPYGIKAFQAMAPLFVMGLDNIFDNFGIHLHFWCDALPQSGCDFREFFQSLKPKDALAGGVSYETRRGLVRVRL